MTLGIGIFVFLLGLICWIGQSLVFLAPDMAQRLGLVEPRKDLDDTFYIIEAKSLGVTDLLLTWTLPLSALLMILSTAHWPLVALVAGGTYVYMAAAIILRRVYLRRHGKKIGSAGAVRLAYIFGALWFASAVVMIVLAVVSLEADSV